MPHHRLLTTLGLAGTTLASLAMADVLDRRRIAADPLAERLRRAPAGEAHVVVARDGTRLHAEAYGDPEAPPVVLVHGWTCALRFWRLQVHDLARDHRVIAYDLRGHGRSGSPDGGDWSLDAMADDLDAVLEALAGGRRALVAGHSLGAMAIVAWAGRHADVVRERAAAAALLNTGIGDLITESLLIPTPGLLGRASDVLGTGLLSAAAPLPSRPNPLSHRAVRFVALSAHAPPAAVRFSEDLVLSCTPRVRAGCGRELSRLDLRRFVERLTVPTLVLAGSEDRLTPPVHARGLARTLPNCAGMIELDRTGHMAPLERDADVTAALRGLPATA
jgi:pimeloyl-ACP methyl ester carboxylesterase